MEKIVFDFTAYKDYLQYRVGPKNERRGIKSSMAQALRCQPSYISQVLNGHTDFSLEQAEVLNKFLGHSDDECFFFLLLVQKERAGTQALRRFFQNQIDELIARRLVLTQRLGQKNSLTDECKSIYYSSWQYSAIHIALTIPELRTRDALARYLHISSRRVCEVLDFLISAGLAQKTNKGFEPGLTHIRLGNDSHQIIKHHAHWRTQAIESLEREKITDLHYSAVVSLSRENAMRIKNRILDEIRDNQAIIKDSKEEELYVYDIDFFSLKRIEE